MLIIMLVKLGKKGRFFCQSLVETFFIFLFTPIKLQLLGFLQVLMKIFAGAFNDITTRFIIAMPKRLPRRHCNFYANLKRFARNLCKLWLFGWEDSNKSFMIKLLPFSANISNTAKLS